MEQLTGLDNAFLAMETRHVYAHVASVCVLDPSTAESPLTLDGVTQLVESRLHLVPSFRRRLVNVPLGLDQPYWIEDPDFDIEYHVRELALPAPGDDHQLAQQVSRLHARHLDRHRPLWELYLIHGLEGGRQAIYTKVHHAAIDGVSGNDILAAVLDLSPEGRHLPELAAWECDERPNALGMLARSAVSMAGHPVRAARLTYELARSVPTLAGRTLLPRLPLVGGLSRPDDVVLQQTGLRAPATPFNRSVGPHRRWAFRSVPFADVKAVKSALGVSVNDVVIALCAGALRRWLVDHRALPDGPLIVSVPVSVRTEDQKGTGGNRVSAMIGPLPTNVPDPVERAKAAHQSMKAAKDQHGALPADLLADVTQFAMPALAGQAARLSARLRLVERINPFNLIISNVPGPSVPLYYAGARLVSYYPLSVVTDGQGLNITVMSYGGALHFGLISDRELVPDLDTLAGYLADELDLLSRAVLGESVHAEAAPATLEAPAQPATAQATVDVSEAASPALAGRGS